MINLISKYSFFFTLLLTLSSSVFAVEKSQREELKQEILNELLKSGALKQQVIKEIKLYEAEKLAIKKKQKQQLKNAISQQAQKKLRPVSVTRDHIYGDPSAPVSIVEFSDFECPYCRKIHPVLKRLVNESNNQVNWVFRHYPLSFHKPIAQQEAEASECIAHLAQNEGFWHFVDALFAMPHRGKQNRDKLINQAASKVNITSKDLNECMKTGQFKQRVLADEKEALDIGLRGTPANILIHHPSKKMRIRQGAAKLQTLKKDIIELLKSNKS